LEVIFSEVKTKPLDEVVDKLEEVNDFDACDVFRKVL
jgi:hypothetical protein